MKKVLVISSSLRTRSNSDSLAREFARGAGEAGHEVEIVSLRGRRIAFCTGCLACQKTQKCVIDDDAPEIVEKMKNADVIAYATPIYYYEMAGQLKTLLDRANPLFPSDYRFRNVYLLATSADTDPHAMDGAEKGVRGWVECFEKCELKGVVRGAGADKAGEIEGSPALNEAYSMGQAV